MRYALLLGLAALLPVSAHAAPPADCQQTTIDANPNIVIPVHVTSHREISTHPAHRGLAFNRYEVTLGARNEFDTICTVHRNSVALFTLADPRRYEFVDIRYYEDGLPSTQILRTEVGRDQIRVINLNTAPVPLKYTIVLRDRATGTVISHDPIDDNQPPV